MATKDKKLIQALLSELANEEVVLTDVEWQFKEARIKFDVSSRKYAAVRDMVTAQLGFSPYTIPIAGWPKTGQHLGNELGRHRFLHMKPGDAAVAVLKEVEEPLTLEDIIEKLASGGFRGANIYKRIINAALMKTTGIEKNEDGKYKYEEPEPEDIPF